MIDTTPTEINLTSSGMTRDQAIWSHRIGTGLYFLSAALVLVALGLFGTASAGYVTILGITMAAKYACLIYFVLGGLAVWSLSEARRRGVRRRMI